MTAVMPLYASVGSNDLARSMPFYADLLAGIGMSKMFDNPGGGAFYGHPNSGMFAVVTPFDKNQATVGNGTMVGFSLPSTQAVDAFYQKALALGGTDEGAPGDRGGGAYFAYFRDLDGNKLCASIGCFRPSSVYRRPMRVRARDPPSARLESSVAARAQTSDAARDLDPVGSLQQSVEIGEGFDELSGSRRGSP